MRQKAASEKMMGLNAEKVVFNVKIIDLNTEVSVKKIIVAFIFKIDCSAIYTAIILINQDIMVLLQTFVLGFEIWCLEYWF